MEKRVRKTINKYGMFSPGATTVAAVSGGADSIAMLHLISRLTAGWKIKIHVAHLNHMFRGKESAEEALFVHDLARKMGLSSTVESYDVPAYIRTTGLSPEEAARKIRYEFLYRVARDVKADTVMTAHHANDQAETVLLHLIRGSGPEGLAAISPREGKLIRPLLEVSKEDILAYCQKNRLAYRIDSSNNEDTYMRNRVRLRLIPQLKELNPQIIDALVKTADICRCENQLLDEMTRAIREKICFVRSGKEAVIDGAGLEDLPPAMQRRVLRAVVDALAQTPGALDFDHTEEILALRQGRKICLPGRLYGRKEGNKLIISRTGFWAGPASLDPVALPVPGRVRIPSCGVEIKTEIIPWPDPGVRTGKLSAVFNRNILADPLWIRTRSPGDRLLLKGLKGTKKLKEFFIDEKVPREMRDSIPLLLSGHKIIWVIGHRTAGQAEPGAEDHEAVAVEVKKLPEA